MRILIADDDLTSRTLLASMLKKAGHEVVSTTSGQEAWLALQKPDAPRLAILDWMMPAMDGLEVVRRVRGLQTDSPPHLIMLTTRGDASDAITALASGANDYLAKPFAFGDLMARIEVGRRMVEMQERLAAQSRERAPGLAAYEGI
jgi:DNA-binding response OmpR family regulator